MGKKMRDTEEGGGITVMRWEYAYISEVGWKERGVGLGGSVKFSALFAWDRLSIVCGHWTAVTDRAEHCPGWAPIAFHVSCRLSIYPADISLTELDNW